MKTQLLLLIAIMVISLNANPFLRKLADTKESCEEAGKDYEITKPAQCKAGNTIYNVTKKEECVAGKWEKLTTPKCSLASITKETDCTGTPVYTAAVEASAASCKKGNVDLPKLAVDIATCEVDLTWSQASCSVSEVSEEECSGKLTYSVVDETKYCKTSAGTNIERLATDATACEVDLTLTAAHCSVEEIKDEDNCKDKPTFKAAVSASDAKCVLGSIEIKDKDRLASKAACETELQWITDGCSITAITDKNDCTATPSFTAETGKCVDKANSNSFLSFKFALLLVVYLLF